jgi:hypothetical protein
MDSSSGDPNPIDALADALEGRRQAVEQIRRACYEHGLLKRGLLGNEYVTAKGRTMMKALTLVDPVVADALQEALKEPMRRRMRAFVSVLLVAYERNS